MTETLIREALRTVLGDEEVLRKMALAQLKVITLPELEELAGRSATTLKRWHQKGYIRLMVYPDTEDRPRYFTTVEMWREDLEKLTRARIVR